MKALVFWRALSENSSHWRLFELLCRDYGHKLLILLESPLRDIESHLPQLPEGMECHRTGTVLNLHPAVRIATGWRRKAEAYGADVFLGLEEPYAAQTYLNARFSRQRGLPLVFMSCQNIDRKLPLPFGWMESRVYESAAGAWFLNREAMQRAERRGFKRHSRVIPLGVDADSIVSHPEMRSHSDDFTVGYVGRLVPEKGVEDLIRACGMCGCRLLAVGDGPERARLTNLAVELGVDAEWTGAVPNSEARKLMGQMDALVLPSLTTATWKEQFGRTLVEAMAAGAPVIGSASGEIPEVLGDAGLLFEEGNCRTLSEKISWLREDSERRMKLVEKGLERVRAKYTWEHAASELNELMELAAGHSL